MTPVRDRDCLVGRVVVVAADTPGAALAAAGAGAAVVLVGRDAGALAAEIESTGGRVVVFTGDLSEEPGRAALVELLDELFPQDAT